MRDLLELSENIYSLWDGVFQYTYNSLFIVQLYVFFGDVTQDGRHCLSCRDIVSLQPLHRIRRNVIRVPNVL